MLIPPVLDTLGRELPLDGLDWDDSPSPQAAVLVALTEEVEPRVILGRRSSSLSLHPGEVAFPGGKREPGDGGPWVTARREAREEVGLDASEVHALGELVPLYTRHGYEVHPCIARVSARPELVVDRREFDSVFLVPMAAFAERSNFRVEAVRYGERIRKVPFYEVDGDTIWGVTAAVLAQLANIAFDAGLDLQRNWTESS